MLERPTQTVEASRCVLKRVRVLQGSIGSFLGFGVMYGFEKVFLWQWVAQRAPLQGSA